MILWSSVAGVVAIGVLVGIGKMVRQTQSWREGIDRDLAPWERAMADFKPKT